MINYLKGKLVSKVDDSPTGCNITVDVNNVGYLLLTSRRTNSLLPPEGHEVTVYTSLIHREDVMYLCGFNTHEDRDLFNILNGVSGIGTKTALAIMGEMGAYNLVNAVISGDDKAIAKTKGIGNKLAQKVILELKEKLTKWRDRVSLSAHPAEDEDDVEVTESMIEAETVLLSLGYTKKEVSGSLKKAISSVANRDDTEELLRTALQWLAGQEG
jgi:holliday junction DNA helicase RuvA